MEDPIAVKIPLPPAVSVAQFEEILRELDIEFADWGPGGETQIWKGSGNSALVFSVGGNVMGLDIQTALTAIGVPPIEFFMRLLGGE